MAGALGLRHCCAVQVEPEIDLQVQEFKRKYFRPFTVGLQIRFGRMDRHQPTLLHTSSLCTAKELGVLLSPHRLLLRTCSRMNVWQLPCRRLKCDGEEGSITCNELPAIENFVAVARSLQRSRGIPDSEFRVFVGADMVESYAKVPQSCYFTNP